MKRRRGFSARRNSCSRESAVPARRDCALPAAWGLPDPRFRDRLLSVPAPGKKWRHVIINTHSSWLHGDSRGFRSRRHRIHSTGDYKHPPPKGEHEGLYRYQVGKSRPEVRLESDLRPIIGRALLQHLLDSGHAVLVIAVTKVHAHVLIELPDNIVKVKSIIGDAKRRASRAVNAQLPGTVWARGGTYKRVTSRNHQRRAYEYILYEQGPEAWTWSFRDRSTEGQFARERPAPPRPHAVAQRNAGRSPK